jgi:NAD(P)-dependent dehydrogenase (short-subunit alcohol dehydrogenase family)
LVIGDINDAAGEALVAELRSQGGEVASAHTFQHCDVTRWEDQVALFKTAVRASPSGGIDAVVANAGVVETGHAASGKGFENPVAMDADAPPPPDLRCVGVNLTGVLYTTHLALYWLPENARPRGGVASSRKKRDRHLLLVGSVAGLLPLVGQSEYTVAKHAVTGLFRSLRGSSFRQGVRVNMLCPYFADTPLIPADAMLILAGANIAKVEDVVDAGTRLMADESIVGRGLVIGPKMRIAEDGEDGEWRLVDDKGNTLPADADIQPKAVWECYAEDAAKLEIFTSRYIGLLNLSNTLKGWSDTFKDLIYIFFYRPKKRS